MSQCRTNVEQLSQLFLSRVEQLFSSQFGQLFPNHWDNCSTLWQH